MHTIPVIDVADAFAGRKVDQAASEIDHALRTYGFFQMVGHGIETSVFDAAYDQMNLLVEDQPESVREALRNKSGHPFYGLVKKYDPVEHRYVAEQFEINRFESPTEALAAGVSVEHIGHFGTNLWPGTEMPDFRPAVSECFNRTSALISPLLSLLAHALGQAGDFFEPHMRRQSTSFAVSRYPYHHFMAPGSPVLEWHTDRETMVNMLHQRGTYDGLQLKVPETGEVLAVPRVPGALVVNVGQLIEMWTNGRWPAVVHGVVSGDIDQWRQSIVTFTAPDVEMPITPLPGTDGAQGTPFRVYDLAADLPRQELNA
ncbi:isopenicillin N synthase family oxygenase [Mycolicibacterium mengxianglii]|uniref:isopenicillin N synthase family oxygenase n=1 Tax=Mycolicibacterium mengxianglii TaxID=2736649 RepID=UPI0018D1CF28|nr:isopenicillin N synthase family oxygenase [Mycolicibacterium mengxianglii]